MSNITLHNKDDFSKKALDLIVTKQQSLQPSELNKIDSIINEAYANTGLTKMGSQDLDQYITEMKMTPFNEGPFSKKNFLKGEQKTPHRIFRQIKMQLDGELQTWYQHNEKHIQTEIEIRKLLVKIKRLDLAQVNRYHSNVIDILNAEKEADTIIEEDPGMSETAKDKIKESFQESAKALQKIEVTKEFTDLDAYEYDLEKLELESKIREKRLQQAQTAKLIKDTALNIEVLEKERDKFKPLVDKLEIAGITFELAENVYWIRRFVENCKLRQFVTKPYMTVLNQDGTVMMEPIVEYLISQEALEQKRKDKVELKEGIDFTVVGNQPVKKYLDTAKDLDQEQIKAIIQLPYETRSRTFKQLGLPVDLKEILQIENDEDDTLENIVEHYKWVLALDDVEDFKKKASYQASDY